MTVPQVKVKSGSESYYDHTKLSFVFPTPTALKKRYLDHGDTNNLTDYASITNYHNHITNEKPNKPLKSQNKTTLEIPYRPKDNYSLRDINNGERTTVHTPANINESHSFLTSASTDSPTNTITTSQSVSVNKAIKPTTVNNSSTQRIYPLEASIFRLLRG